MVSYEQVGKFESEKPQDVIRLMEANGFYRMYAASRSMRRIYHHLHAVSPRINGARAQAVVNSSLGVFSHYASFILRKVVASTSGLIRFGEFSRDRLRYYPNVFDWKPYRLKGIRR